MTNHSVIDVQLGAGCEDLFELKISIEEFQVVPKSASAAAAGSNNNDSPSSSATQYWLSYRCFGKVIQSELFSIPGGRHSVDATNDRPSPFVPTIQTFRVKREELTSYFLDKKNVTLRIHLCTEGNVVATAAIDFETLMTTFEKEVVVQNEYNFKPRMAEESDQISCCVAVTLSLENCQPAAAFGVTEQQHQHSKTAAIQTTSPLEPSPSRQETDDKSSGNAEDDSQRRRQAQLLEEETRLQIREEQLSTKEKEISESLASLEKKRFEWEQFKHREELTWQKKAREKEAEIMSSIEERITLNEKERLVSMEKSKSEYEQLESRLTKAILEVEKKDRTLKELLESLQHEYKRKNSELVLSEKLTKQEMKHSVEIEQAKATAALEQAVLAKKESAEATKKVKRLEAEMDELREKHRKTPEAALVQQLAEMKGDLADGERRFEAVKAEKNQILLDKEKFRTNVRKLAKALRLERDKAVKSREQINQNVRLSYDDSSGQFVLGGDENEVTRILTDLSKLTQQQQTMGSNCSSPVPLPSPLPSRPLGMDEVLSNMSFELPK